MTAFDDEAYDVFSSGNETGEELWTDFISPFRSHSLGTGTKDLTYKRCQLLRSRGIHVDSGRETSQAMELTILLFCEAHISAREVTQNQEPGPDTPMTQKHEGIQEKEYKPIDKASTLTNRRDNAPL